MFKIFMLRLFFTRKTRTLIHCKIIITNFLISNRQLLSWCFFIKHIHLKLELSILLQRDGRYSKVFYECERNISETHGTVFFLFNQSNWMSREISSYFVLTANHWYRKINLVSNAFDKI